MFISPRLTHRRQPVSGINYMTIRYLHPLETFYNACTCSVTRPCSLRWLIMPETVPILVQERPVPDNSWKKFVAVLCFIEFYVEFVHTGDAFWTTMRSNLAECDLIGDIAWVITRTIRVASFYLLGRSLWLDRGWKKPWLAGAIITSLLFFILTYYTSVRPGSFYRIFGWAGIGPFWFTVSILNTYILWLALLIGVFIIASNKSFLQHTGKATWVILAVSWVTGELVGSFLAPFGIYISPISLNLQTCFQYLKPLPISGLIGTGFYIAVLSLLIVGLFKAWRWTRTIALILATAGLFFAIESGMTIGWLVMIAIQALYYSCPYLSFAECKEMIFWPDYFLLNEHAFKALFVSTVAYAGPWLLIAIFAWRVPMRRLPDDGSPWPRQFCGQCRYNLYGIGSERCPECGVYLDRSPVQQTA